MKFNFLNKITNIDEKRTKKEIKNEIIRQNISLVGTAVNLADFIAPIEIFFDRNFIYLDGVLGRTFTFQSFPQIVPINWATALLPLNTHCRFCLKLEPIDDINAKNIIKRIKLDLRSGEELQRKLTKDPEYYNPEVEKVIQELTIREEQLAYQKGIEKMWWLRTYLTILYPVSGDMEEAGKYLDDFTKSFISELAGTGFMPVGLYTRELEGLIFNSPFTLHDVPYTNKFFVDTSSVAYSLIIGSADISHPNGIEFGINMHTRGMIKIDPYRYANPHILVLGKSGSGKSSLAKAISLREHVKLGVPLRIIDPAGEYEEIANLFGADIIKFSLKGSKVYYNPFKMDFIPISRDEDIFNEKIVFLADLINVLCGETLSQEQIAGLQFVIEELYKSKGIYKGDFESYRRPAPELEDLIFFLRTKGGDPTLSSSRWSKSNLQAIADLLSPWGSKGPYGEFFNKGDNPNRVELSLDKDFIVFDISEMLDQFKKVSFMLILHLLSLEKKERKRLVLDEGWRIIQESETAKKFMKELLLARKKGLGITLITTDVEHFMSDLYGSSILNQFSIYATFMVERNEIEMMKRILKLTEEEAVVINASKSSSGYYLLKAHNIRMHAYNMLSDFEFNLFKTNITEKEIKEV